jgi:hypothetical protein
MPLSFFRHTVNRVRCNDFASGCRKIFSEEFLAENRTALCQRSKLQIAKTSAKREQMPPLSLDWRSESSIFGLAWVAETAPEKRKECYYGSETGLYETRAWRDSRDARAGKISVPVRVGEKSPQFGQTAGIADQRLEPLQHHLPRSACAEKH